MKKSNIYIYILYLFIISCDDPSHLITNDITGNPDYDSSFTSNSGENKYTVTLSWSKYSQDDFVNYQLFENTTLLETILDPNNTNFSINMNLNQIKLIKLIVNNTYESELTIFTAPVSSASNLQVNGNANSNILTWASSQDSDIYKTTIYRAQRETGQSPPLINDDGNGNPESGSWVMIHEQEGSINTYTDSDILSNANYFYTIKVTDNHIGPEGYRYSFVNSNISGAVVSNINFNVNLNPSTVEYPDKTSFTWNDYSNNDFYELQIHRSTSQNFTINEDGFNSTKIATFSNIIDSFNDYDGIYAGATWYYKLRFYDIYGNSLDSQEITCKASIN